METLVSDLRYGIRSLMKRPGFAAVAILSLALGIGVDTTTSASLMPHCFDRFPSEKKKSEIR